MIFQHYLWLYLWIAPHVLLVPIAVLMSRKGLRKEFPIFFCYLVFEFLQFCVLLALHFRVVRVSIPRYVMIDMLGRAGSITLRFGIIQEMFESPLAHNVPLRRAMARILNWTTGVLIVMAAVFIGSIYYSVPGHHVFQAYTTAEALNTAQWGLLILVFVWHRYLGMRMSPYVFGIALGIGLAACLDPLILALKDSFAPQYRTIPDFLQMAVFHGAVLVWLYYFAQTQEEGAPQASAAQLLEVGDWGAELGRIARL